MDVAAWLGVIAKSASPPVKAWNGGSTSFGSVVASRTCAPGGAGTGLKKSSVVTTRTWYGDPSVAIPGTPAGHLVHRVRAGRQALARQQNHDPPGRTGNDPEREVARERSIALGVGIERGRPAEGLERGLNGEHIGVRHDRGAHLRHARRQRRDRTKGPLT
jgi:hypothetical protein